MTSFISWLLGCSNFTFFTFKQKGLESTSSWQPAQSNIEGISPNGQLIAARARVGDLRVVKGLIYGGKTRLQIIKIEDRSIIQMVDESKINSTAFSYDNSLIAVGDYYGEINIYQINTGKLLRSITVPKIDPEFCIRERLFNNNRCSVGKIQFSPNNKYMVSYTGNQGVDVWNVASGSQLYRIDKNRLNKNRQDGRFFDISPDSKFFALGGDFVELYRLSDGQLVRRLEQDGMVKFSPDGETLATFRLGILSLYNLKENIHPRKLVISEKTLPGWKFSPDGKYLLVVAHTKAESTGGSIHVGDNRSRKLIRRASSEIAVYQVDNLSKQKLSIPEGHRVTDRSQAFFSEDGNFVFILLEDKTAYKKNIFIWDISKSSTDENQQK